MRKITFILATIAASTAPLMAGRYVTTAEAAAIIDVNLSPRISAVPAESWAPQDPADAVWRQARNAINAREWAKAAAQFQRIRTDSAFKNSAYSAESYYWEAYARAQMGGSTQLKAARTLLETLQSEHSDVAKSIRDAQSLLASVQGRLSKEFGDEDASAKLLESANKLSVSADKLAGGLDKLNSKAARLADKDKANGRRNPNCPDDDDDSPRMAALHAVLQMDAELALPILEKILARRDECSAELRARAIYMVAQKRTARSADILLDVIRTDPDEEVQQQAVYWLGQVDSEKALTALEGILRSAKSEELASSALWSVAQSRSPKANQLLRDYAARSDISTEVRATAIHWLGQSNSESNYAFLRDLFTKVRDNESKEQIIFAMSQRNTAESADWLMSIVMDENQNVELRNQALHWAANAERSKNGTVTTTNAQKLIALYDRLSNREMKQQLIYSYAQHKDDVFLDKLMDIAKNDKDKELRTTSIYWLGQVGGKNPRVLKFLTDLING